MEMAVFLSVLLGIFKINFLRPHLSSLGTFTATLRPLTATNVSRPYIF
jgi:hypothetical protein